MSELSHFETLSAKTPTKQPWAILGGTAFVLILLYVISALAPNDAIKQAKADAASSSSTAEAVPAAQAQDDEEL